MSYQELDRPNKAWRRAAVAAGVLAVGCLGVLGLSPGRSESASGALDAVAATRRFKAAPRDVRAEIREN